MQYRSSHGLVPVRHRSTSHSSTLFFSLKGTLRSLQSLVIHILWCVLLSVSHACLFPTHFFCSPRLSAQTETRHVSPHDLPCRFSPHFCDALPRRFIFQRTSLELGFQGVLAVAQQSLCFVTPSSRSGPISTGISVSRLFRLCAWGALFATVSPCLPGWRQ